MNKLICFKVLAILGLMIVLTGCEKDEPVPTKPPHALIANAGRDTTIYLPFNSARLLSSGSTYSNIDSVSIYWRKISGPAPHMTLSWDEGGANISGMVKVGEYGFELSLIDKFDLRVSRDTVRVIIAEPFCANGIGEIILTDLTWESWWGGPLYSNIIEFFSYIPSNSFLKNIYIKWPHSDDWVLVQNVVPANPPYHDPYWFYVDDIMVIDSGYSGNGQPDVKLEYCY